MSVLTLAETLKKLNIRLQLVDGKLRVQAPAGALTDDIKAQMRQYKKELIQSLERAEAIKKQGDKTIKKADRSADLPLSFAQQRMWLLNKIEPESTAYNMSSAMLLTGDVNRPALQAAINALQYRHEILRTCYQLEEGEDNSQPQQKILQAEQVSIESYQAQVADASYPITELTVPENVRHWLIEQANKPFDLSQDKPLRVQMVDFSKQQLILQWVVHHIAVDAWSMGIISRDFAVLYRLACAMSKADAQALVAELPTQTLQYADFAKWQRDWLVEDRLQEQMNYWRENLGVNQPILALPFNGLRNAQRSEAAGRFHFKLDDELNRQISQLNRVSDENNQVTPYVLLLATFQRLLHDFSGQQDIRVGVPTASRHNAQIQSLVGCFINPLVMKADFDIQQTVNELIAQCQQRSVEAQEYQDVPFEMLVDELVTDRDMGVSPLFQVMFNYLQQDSVELQDTEIKTGDMQFKNIAFNPQPAKFDLSLMVQAKRQGTEKETQSSFHCVFEYDPTLLSESFIQRLSEYYKNLLDGICKVRLSNQDCPLSRLRGANEQQIQEQLACWNDTNLAIPDEGIESLIAAESEKQGSRTAVSFRGSRLSYRALSERSNQLGHVLQAQGIGVGDRVGVCLGRSLDLLVSVLAIQKVGAAYVPLDPAYPAERIQYMLDDADLRLILVDREVLDSELLMDLQVPRINVSDASLLLAQETHAPLHAATGEDLAYLIYTSGSTGRPKAVAVTRANLVNFIVGMQALLALSAEDRLLAVTSLSFDIAALEWYLPLLCGAEVVLGDETLGMDGERLRAALTSGITVMQATPVTWKLALAAGWQGAQGFTALCGGEAFPVE
ncbi:MAG: condensation domain-containing protein, partial [Pseudomonadota bacterium]